MAGEWEVQSETPQTGNWEVAGEEPIKTSEPDNPAQITRKLKGNLARNLLESAGSTVDMLVDLPKAWANPNADLDQFSRYAGKAADWLGLPKDEQTPLGKYGGIAERAAGSVIGTGPMAPAKIGSQIAASTSGAMAGEVARERGYGPVAQLGLSAAAGTGASAVMGLGNTVRNFTNDPRHIRDLLGSGREAVLEGGTAQNVQTAIRGEVSAAKAPFPARYREAEAAQPKAAPPPTMHQQVDWGMPLTQAEQQIPIVSSVTARYMRKNADIVGTPEVQSALKAASHIDTSTVSGMKNARSIILEDARKFAKAGQTQRARVLNGIAEGMQRDMDRSLMSDMGRLISRDYRAGVIVPFRRATKLGALSGEADPEQVFAQIMASKPSANDALRSAVGPATVEVVQQKMLSDLITGVRGVSANATVNAYRRAGLDRWFAPDEWQGIVKLASSTTAKNAYSMRAVAKGAAIVVGASTASTTAGKIAASAIGYGAEKTAEALIRSTAGRRFLARLAYQTPKQIKESMSVLIRSPALAEGMMAEEPQQ